MNKSIIIFLILIFIGCNSSQPKVSKLEKPVPFLLEVDWPGGEHELELEIHPNLINGEEPFVEQNRPNVLIVKAEKGKQTLKIYIKPIIHE